VTKRVVVLVTGRDPSRGLGGGSHYVRAHARALQGAGFEAHVFCVSPRAGENGGEEMEFGTVHRIASPLFGIGAALEKSAASGFFREWLAAFAYSPYAVCFHAERLVTAIVAFLSPRPGPHVVHGFYTWADVAVRVERRMHPRAEVLPLMNAFTLAADECRAKIRGSRGVGRWLSLAELAWIRAIVDRCEKRGYREARLVGVNYDSVRALLESRYGRRSGIRKLLYGPESSFRAAAPASFHAASPARSAPAEGPGVPRVLTVSRHDSRKGIDVLLRALALLRSRNVDFRAVLLSGGPWWEAHRRLSRQLGLDDRVDFTGWVADAVSFFPGADVFVLPSLQEGSGSLSLLEALQAGITVVASNVDGIAEDVVNGENALLFDCGDADHLAGVLERVLTNRSLREALGRAGRETFLARHSAAAFTGSLKAFYAELGVYPDESARMHANSATAARRTSPEGSSS
jgi:glycosyltransferase involved in cell wall biosynthesis